MAIARDRMRRALLMAATAWPLAVAAQQPKKIWRIGHLSGVTAGQDPFRQRLREQGYVEGFNERRPSLR